MRVLIPFAVAIFLSSAQPGQQTEITPRAAQDDIDALWQHIADNYAYFDQKSSVWSSVPALYDAERQRVRTRRDLVVVLERIVEELYDHHAHLTTNTPESRRLVPSGADIWASWLDARATVVEVRADSDAQRADIRAGDGIVSIGGIPIGTAIAAQLPRSPAPDDAVRSWALRVLLAGRRNEPRAIGLTRNREARTVWLPAREQSYPRSGLLAFRVLPGNGGYIRVHDSLGDHNLIEEFDNALEKLRNTSTTIVDLRDTPGGGNTTVARAILGRFVRRELPYQKHVLPSAARETGVVRSWLELVTPRGPFQYQRPVAVLVNHWTGSMGEGLAIGFDATGSGIVVGTPMAGLLGATYRFELPHSRIGVNVPAERLFHVDGTPREQFVPPVRIDPSVRTSDDPWIAAARDALARAKRP